MRSRRQRPRSLPVLAALTVVGVAIAVAGCGLGVEPASPTVRPELAWSRAAIELPDDVSEIAPGSTPGMVCSPCHAEQASLMLGVTTTSDGFLAVGVQLPPPSGIAYTSADGRAWTPVTGFEPGAETRALAAAADSAGRIVIVGTAGSSAGAWTRATPDSPWLAAPDAPSLRAPAGGTAEMRAVTPWGDGWVAVGSIGAADGARRAAIWRSNDGLAWDLVSAGGGGVGGAAPDNADEADDQADQAAFGDARAFGVAAAADGRVVVVGAAGEDGSGAGIAWTTADGADWTRIDGDALDAGPMRAVTAFAGGFVAVGSGLGDDRAVAWTSPDGTDWEAAPDQDAFDNNGRPIRMLGVTAAGGPGEGDAEGDAAGGADDAGDDAGDDARWGGLLAAGWKSDAGNGTGIMWRSTDGRTWARIADQASMSGGSLSGVVIAGGRPVVVGTTGSPDNDQASAWIPEP